MPPLPAVPAKPLRSNMLWILVVAAILLINWSIRINDSAIEHDALENLIIASNLADSAAFSVDQPNSGRSMAPSRLREPIPPLVTAAYLKVLSLFFGPLDVSWLEHGPGANVAKFVNLFWAAIICASVGAALLMFTENFRVAIIGALVAGLLIRINTLYTEIAAQALLALFSLLLVVAIKSGRAGYWCVAGAALGGLVLTKAIFLYVGLMLLLGGLIYLLARWAKGKSLRREVTGGILLVASAAAIVSPWMVRNYRYFGSADITDRGGHVLYIRALQNQMTDEEYVGAIYSWASEGPVKKLIGAAFGLSPEDDSKGGRLQRLQQQAPDDYEAYRSGNTTQAISYYGRGRAELTKLHHQLASQGIANPAGAADAQLKQRAILLIADDPLSHISMIPLYLWRGAPLATPLFLAFAVLAFWRRRFDVLIYMAPAAAMVLFLSVFTHFNPRFSVPAVPILVVAAFTLGVLPYRRERGPAVPG